MKRAALRFGLLVTVALGAVGICVARAPMEASMTVTGVIHIAADGHTQSYTLDKQDKLPPEAIEVMQRTVPAWRFQQTLKDGVPVPVDAKMFVRLIARRNDAGSYGIFVGGADFDTQIVKATSFGHVDRTAPRYPMDAVRSRISGDVYLIVHVGSDGRATDVSAEQVNLTGNESEPNLAKARKLLADASIEAARKWTYQPPADARADQHSWIIRTSVNYSISSSETVPDVNNRWIAYLPGPKEPVPWLEKYRHPNDGLDTASDVVPEGEVYWAGAGLTLLNQSPQS